MEKKAPYIAKKCVLIFQGGGATVSPCTNNKLTQTQKVATPPLANPAYAHHSHNIVNYLSYFTIYQLDTFWQISEI